MTRQRLTRKQIREDPLVTWTYEARAWAEQNSMRLLIGVAAIVLIAGIATAVRNSRAGAERGASSRLAQAQFQLWGNNPTQALQMADDVVASYPGTRSATISQLVRASALYDQGQPQQAIEAYDSFLASGKQPEGLWMAATRGRAAALEDSGRHADAAQAWEELGRRDDAGVTAAMDLVAAARCYQLAGDTERARTLYQEVLDEHPDLQDPVFVRLKLHELGG